MSVRHDTMRDRLVAQHQPREGRFTVDQERIVPAGEPDFETLILALAEARATR